MYARTAAGKYAFVTTGMMMYKRKSNLIICNKCYAHLELPKGFYSIVQFLIEKGWAYCGSEHWCKECFLKYRKEN